jgi:hypothetical protein
MLTVAVPKKRILKGSSGRVGVGVGAEVGFVWHTDPLEVIARLLHALAVDVLNVFTAQALGSAIDSTVTPPIFAPLFWATTVALFRISSSK